MLQVMNSLLASSTAYVGTAVLVEAEVQAAIAESGDVGARLHETLRPADFGARLFSSDAEEAIRQGKYRFAHPQEKKTDRSFESEARVFAFPLSLVSSGQNRSLKVDDRTVQMAGTSDKNDGSTALIPYGDDGISIVIGDGGETISTEDIALSISGQRYERSAVGAASVQLKQEMINQAATNVDTVVGQYMGLKNITEEMGSKIRGHVQDLISGLLQAPIAVRTEIIEILARGTEETKAYLALALADNLEAKEYFNAIPDMETVRMHLPEKPRPPRRVFSAAAYQPTLELARALNELLKADPEGILVQENPGLFGAETLVQLSDGVARLNAVEHMNNLGEIAEIIYEGVEAGILPASLIKVNDRGLITEIPSPQVEGDTVSVGSVSLPLRADLYRLEMGEGAFVVSPAFETLREELELPKVDGKEMYRHVKRFVENFASVNSKTIDDRKLSASMLGVDRLRGQQKWSEATKALQKILAFLVINGMERIPNHDLGEEAKDLKRQVADFFAREDFVKAQVVLERAAQMLSRVRSMIRKMGEVESILILLGELRAKDQFHKIAEVLISNRDSVGLLAMSRFVLETLETKRALKPGIEASVLKLEQWLRRPLLTAVEIARAELVLPPGERGDIARLTPSMEELERELRKVPATQLDGRLRKLLRAKGIRLPGDDDVRALPIPSATGVLIGVSTQATPRLVEKGRREISAPAANPSTPEG